MLFYRLASQCHTQPPGSSSDSLTHQILACEFWSRNLLPDGCVLDRDRSRPQVLSKLLPAQKQRLVDILQGLPALVERLFHRVRSAAPLASAPAPEPSELVDTFVGDQLT